MNVREVMTSNPRCVSPNDSIQVAARIMREEDTGVVPIVENGKPVGVVTDRDIAIRVVAEGRDGGTRVSDVMSSSRLATLRPDADVNEAMERMADEQVRRIPIVDDRGSLIGIVAQADVVRKVRDDKKSERTVEKISQPSGRHSQ